MFECFRFQSKEVPPPQSIENAHALLFLGDKVTTDHISPAGSIARVSAAAKYLMSKRSVSAFSPCGHIHLNLSRQLQLDSVVINQRQVFKDDGNG